MYIHGVKYNLHFIEHNFKKLLEKMKEFEFLFYTKMKNNINNQVNIYSL